MAILLQNKTSWEWPCFYFYLFLFFIYFIFLLLEKEVFGITLKLDLQSPVDLIYEAIALVTYLN